MIPILYPATEQTFTTEGLGRLTDAVSCLVTEARNGEYELFMEYPVSGAIFDSIQHDTIIFAVPADGKPPQPFRVYRIEKPLNGICSIYAEHISYQLNLIPVMPFTANGIVYALNGLISNAAEDCPFSVWTDKATEGTYTVKTPDAFRALLGGQEGSILDVFGGGEYEWDRWTVKLYQNRGVDNGVSIRYGKNLVDLKQDENIQNTYTGICPFWLNEETGDLVLLPEKVLWTDNAENYPFKRTKVISFNEQYDEAPTVAQLRAAAISYMDRNNFGVPSVNLDVAYIDLHSVSGGALERVNLCDTVTVIFETLGVSATAKVIETKYDVLKDRYDTVTIGDAKTTLGGIIDNAVEQIMSESIEGQMSRLQQYVQQQTALITGGLGGYVVINQNADGYPNEILIMDTPDKETAVNVIRMNQNGIGFSTNGYDGPFSTAWTIDGVFNASFIGAGRLDGNYIKAHTINAQHMTIGDPTNYVTVSETYPASMLGVDSPLGATVVNAGGYVEKGSSTNTMLALSDILAAAFSSGDELFYEIDIYAPSAKTVRMAVIFYDQNGAELERFTSDPISVTASTQRKTGNLVLDYAHINGDGNLVLPMASVSNGTLTFAHSNASVTNGTLSFPDYSSAWESYAIVLLDSSNTQLYFRRAVIRRKVSGELIVSGSISADAIMLGAVSEGKLASALGNKINSSADILADITTTDSNITYIDGGKIYTGSIYSGAIATGAITVGKLSSGVTDLISDAQTAADDANTLAAGKSTVYYRTTDPPASGTYNAGDVWIKQVSSGTGGDVMWTYSGSAWVKHEIGTTTIIDGSITTDLLAANAVTTAKLKAGAVTAEKISVNDLSALNATIGGIQINNNSIASSNGKFNLTSDGLLTATGASLTGALEAESGNYKAKLDSGHLDLYYGSTLYGRISGAVQSNSNVKGIRIGTIVNTSFIEFGEVSENGNLIVSAYKIEQNGADITHKFFGDTNINGAVTASSLSVDSLTVGNKPCELLYTAGDSITNKQMGAFGYVTGTGNQISIFIPLQKSVASGVTATCTRLDGTIYSTDGYVGGHASFSFVSYITSTTILSNGIKFLLYNSSGWGVTANTPLTGDMTNVTINFS